MSITNSHVKNRFSLAYVVCLLYPDLFSGVDRAINDMIATALPQLEARAAGYISRYGKPAPDLAGDVVSDWMVRLCERDLAFRYDPARGSAAAYFGRIMEIVALEALRPFRRQVTNVDWGDLALIEIKTDVAADFSYAELLQLVRDRYLRLAPRQREAILLKFPFLDEGDAGNAVASTDGDRPKPPKPNRVSVSRGRAAIQAHVRAMTK